MINNPEVKLYQSQWIWRFLKIGLNANSQLDNYYIRTLPKIHIEILKSNKAALIDHQLVTEDHIRYIIKFIKETKVHIADNINMLRNVCVTDQYDYVRRYVKLVFEELIKTKWLENIVQTKFEKGTFYIMKIRETTFL